MKEKKTRHDRSKKNKMSKLRSVISLLVLHLHTIKALLTQIALRSQKHSESVVIWGIGLLQTSSGALGRTTRGVAATYGLTQAALLNGPDQWRQSVFTEDLARLRSSSFHNGLTLPELTHLPKSSSDQNLLRFLFFFWIQWNMRWTQPQSSSLCVWRCDAVLFINPPSICVYIQLGCVRLVLLIT